MIEVEVEQESPVAGGAVLATGRRPLRGGRRWPTPGLARSGALRGRLAPALAGTHRAHRGAADLRRARRSRCAACATSSGTCPGAGAGGPPGRPDGRAAGRPAARRGGRRGRAGPNRGRGAARARIRFGLGLPDTCHRVRRFVLGLTAPGPGAESRSPRAWRGRGRGAVRLERARGGPGRLGRAGGRAVAPPRGGRRRDAAADRVLGQPAAPVCPPPVRPGPACSSSPPTRCAPTTCRSTATVGPTDTPPRAVGAGARGRLPPRRRAVALDPAVPRLAPERCGRTPPRRLAPGTDPGRDPDAGGAVPRGGLPDPGVDRRRSRRPPLRLRPWVRRLPLPGEDGGNASRGRAGEREPKRCSTGSRAHADEPFFLFFHTYETHTPLEPREPFFTRLRGRAGPLPDRPLNAEPVPPRRATGFRQRYRFAWTAPLPDGVGLRRRCRPRPTRPRRPAAGPGPLRLDHRQPRLGPWTGARAARGARPGRRHDRRLHLGSRRVLRGERPLRPHPPAGHQPDGPAGDLPAPAERAAIRRRPGAARRRGPDPPRDGRPGRPPRRGTLAGSPDHGSTTSIRRSPGPTPPGRTGAWGCAWRTAGSSSCPTPSGPARGHDELYDLARTRPKAATWSRRGLPLRASRALADRELAAIPPRRRDRRPL